MGQRNFLIRLNNCVIYLDQITHAEFDQKPSKTPFKLSNEKPGSQYFSAKTRQKLLLARKLK